MSENEYKPNSYKSKEEVQSEPSEKKKQVEKVVSGTVKTKKNTVRKFTDVFISEDVKNVKSYILMDVLVPAVKKAVSDIITNGIDMILYGGNGSSRSRSNASKVSYRNYYEHRDDRGSSNNYRTVTGYSYDDVILSNRGEAEEVMTRMNELIETYGIATVADLYDLVGVSGNYTDNKYGWTNLRNADVVRVSDGYKLKLPRALPIN